jgi:hypothetical protein
MSSCLARAFALWAVLVSSVAAQERPPLRRLDLPRRAGDGAGPLDWVFEKVESGKDQWSFERSGDEVAERLHVLDRWLRQPGPASDAALERLLDEEFRGSAPLPELSPVASFGDGVSAWRGPPPEAPRARGLDRARWIEALRRLRAECGTAVAKSKFKVFRVLPLESEGAAAPVRVSTRILLELDGRAPSGSFVQLRAIWDLDWKVENGAWSLIGMGEVLLEKASQRARDFADATWSCLGGSAAFAAQLARGTGEWLTRIDSASGIDIYGHQGIAVGDYDGDGLDDFYVAQPAGLPNRLFRNRGDGAFEAAAASAGADVLDVTAGALFADFDNDGDADLAVVTGPGVLLFENLGGRFRRVEASGLEADLEEGASTLGAAAADYDLDGDLDLYVFSYVFWAGSGSKRFSSYPYPYHDANNGAPNFLFRNEGGLRFRDVTAASGIDENNRRFSLAASWCDFDDDGDPDLYVANDFGRNNLYLNDGRGRFRDAAVERGVDDVGNGMSVAWEDFDNDGRIDLYVGNMWSSAGQRIAGMPQFESDALRSTYQRMARGNSLFRNLGGGRFEDVSIASGASFGRWAWGCAFIDVDADGWEDLYVANGFVSNERKDDL